MQGFSFSQKLVDRLIRYMHTEHGVTLTPEESNEWLRVYADAFLTFADDGGGATARRPSARVVPTASDSTGASNTCGTLQIAP